MNRLLVLTGLLALTAAPTPALAQEVVGRHDATLSISEVVSRGGWVRIASFNGPIDIAPTRGDRVEIRATKTMRRGSVEDIGFVVRREDGGVTVCAVYDDADECDRDGHYRGHRDRGNRAPQGRVEFVVRVPDGVRIRAASGNGDLRIGGTSQEVEASTGNGRIDISGSTGEVTASTGNGRLTIADAHGQVEASSGSGDVRVVTSDGPVSAHTGNGDIEVSMARLDGSPDMQFTTGNGRVTLELPEGYSADLDATTGNGDVTSDFAIRTRGRLEHSRLRGTIGNGGGRLSISSGNGDVEIRRRP